MIEKIHSQINFPTKLRISFPETKVTKKSLEVEEFNYLQNSNLRFLIDISQKKAICFFLKIHPSRSSKEALKEGNDLERGPRSNMKTREGTRLRRHIEFAISKIHKEEPFLFSGGSGRNA